MQENKKIAKIALITLMLLIPMFLTSNTTQSDPDITSSDITKFTSKLIETKKDYLDAGYDPSKIVDPIYYEREVLCEGHIPIILDIECAKQFYLDTTYKNEFLRSVEASKTNIGNIVYTYNILIKEEFTKKVPIYSKEKIEVKNNRTGEISYVEQQYISGYENVEDYKCVWYDIAYLNKIDFKLQNKIIIDIQGNFKAGLNKKQVDIIPKITIGEYTKTLTEYAWWDSDWEKCKEITITNAIIGYQMRLNVTYDADMQADFDDLRFVDSDNITLLDYWIEYKVDSDYAIVWVELLDNGDTIYMYYGNASATADSNGADTWDYFLIWDADHTGDFTERLGTSSNTYHTQTTSLGTTVSLTNGVRVLHFTKIEQALKTNTFGVSAQVLLLKTDDDVQDSNDHFYSSVSIDNDYGVNDNRIINNAENGGVSTSVYDESQPPNTTNYYVFEQKGNTSLLNLTYHTVSSDTPAIFDIGLTTNIPDDDLSYLGYGSFCGSNDAGDQTYWSYDAVNDAIQWGAYNSGRCTVKLKNKWVAIGMFSDPEPIGAFGAEFEEAGPAITLSNETPADAIVGVNLSKLPSYNATFDWNFDGVIDIRDRDVFMDHWLETGDPGWLPYDLNEDGVINYLDISVLISILSYLNRIGILFEVNVTHITNATCNATFYTNATGSWETFGYNCNLTNETARQYLFYDFKWNTVYYWNISVTDDLGNWTNATYSFTVEYQEYNVTFAYPNNTFLTPDPSAGYFQVNVSSLVPTNISVYFMTNISGSWEVFDHIESSNGTYVYLNTTNTVFSVNTSWCSFNANNYWSANITGHGVWHNETFNFTTDECYQILSYDPVYIIPPTYEYVRLGDFRAQSTARRFEDTYYAISTVVGTKSLIEILYYHPLEETTLTNFKLRCLLNKQTGSPASWFKLYVNGVDCGYATSYGDFQGTAYAQAQSIPPSTGKSLPNWDNSWLYGVSPYRYLEWENINITISGPVVFEIFKPADKGFNYNYELAVFSRMKQRGLVDGTDAYDTQFAMMNDNVLKNAKFHSGADPNGVWDGNYPALIYAPGHWRPYEQYCFRYYKYHFSGSSWNIVLTADPPSAAHFYTANAGIIYEFTYMNTIQSGVPLLQGTSPANNSQEISLNPNLECYIITNLRNFTYDMNPVFVSVQTNHTGPWVEIWNNTGNYSHIFPSEGTFNINSSQYTFSFNETNTTYYWKVCTRKLTPGANWTNRTYNFKTVLVRANFTYVITNYTVLFNSTSQYPAGITFFTWTFGDGKYGDGKTVSHIYAGNGTFPVTLLVENMVTGKNDAITKNILINVSHPPDVTTNFYTNIDFSFVFPFLYVLIMLIILLWFYKGLDGFEEDVFNE